MSGLELVVWGLFAASIGRLIAQDTVLLQQRNRVLDRVCRLYDAPYAWHDRMEQGGGRSLRAIETSGNVGVGCEKVGFPGRVDEDDCMWHAPTRGHAWFAELITCPYCVAFWAAAFPIAVTWLITGHMSPPLIVWPFAVWQIAQASIRWRNT